MIDKILCDELQKASADNEVAVLLSGGVDSISVAFAAARLKKNITAYTFHLVNQPTYDAEKAKSISSIMGWNCVTIEVPVDNLKNDFIRLRRQIECIKKTHYECCFPFLYVYPKITQTEVLSGWAADGYYGVSKKANLHYKHTMEKFNVFREEYFSENNRAGYNWHARVAAIHDKKFITPYLSDAAKNFFWAKDWYELNIPYQKHHVVESFEEFELIGKVKKHINLQLGSGIDKLFESVLLLDRSINFRNRNRIMDMCKDWSKM
jgi:asparagine synthetase B (glutamine-hydrolysing)